jgi:hypothetical protein
MIREIVFAVMKERDRIYKILDQAQIPDTERQRIKSLIDEQQPFPEREEVATGS